MSAQKTNQNAKQAKEALQTLGFKSKEADSMIKHIDPDLTTTEIIRLALKNK